MGNFLFILVEIFLIYFFSRVFFFHVVYILLSYYRLDKILNKIPIYHILMAIFRCACQYIKNKKKSYFFIFNSFEM